MESSHSLILLSVFYSFSFVSQALVVFDTLYLALIEWSSANLFMSRVLGMAGVTNEQ